MVIHILNLKCLRISNVKDFNMIFLNNKNNSDGVYIICIFQLKLIENIS